MLIGYVATPWHTIINARVSAVHIPVPFPVHTVPLQQRHFLPAGVIAPTAVRMAVEKHAGFLMTKTSFGKVQIEALIENVKKSLIMVVNYFEGLRFMELLDVF